MKKSIGMSGLVILACLISSAALADASVTVTATNTKCAVAPPDEVGSNSPSVAAGEAAIKNQNYALAKANFKPLAEKGDADGERAYGAFLLMKCTGLQDEVEGATWLQKASDAGNIAAAAQLGNAYMNGAGVTQDDGKAFVLLSKAAMAGQPLAEVNLGYLYLSGRGVSRDPYQAMVWSVKGGEQGMPAALVNIAAAYFKGGPLPQDTDQAIYFAYLALERSTPEQKARFASTLNGVLRNVSASDAARASQRARRWSPGEGSLSDVLRDATRRRDQVTKNTSPQ